MTEVTSSWHKLDTEPCSLDTGHEVGRDRGAGGGRGDSQGRRDILHNTQHKLLKQCINSLKFV